MFHEEYHYRQWNEGFVKRYVFNEPWRFVLRVKPNMITKIRVIDGRLESRMQEIDNYLKANDHRKRQTKILYGSNRWKYWKVEEMFSEKYPFRNKSVEKIMDEFKN